MCNLIPFSLQAANESPSGPVASEGPGCVPAKLGGHMEPPCAPSRNPGCRPTSRAGSARGPFSSAHRCNRRAGEGSAAQRYVEASAPQGEFGFLMPF